MFFGESMIMGCNDDMTFKVLGDHLFCGMEHGHSNMLHLGYIKTYSILIAYLIGVDATFSGRKTSPTEEGVTHHCWLPPMPIASQKRLLGSLG